MLAGVFAALQEVIVQVLLRAGDEIGFGVAILAQASSWIWMIALSFLITALLCFPDGTRLGPWGCRTGSVVIAVAILFIPFAIAMAMHRYRLYDIDRVVSRSVAYSLVAAVLGLVYAGGVVVLQTISPASGNLAVAVSTLAVAVLFNPVRLRVQRWVDRRFNRAAFNAELEVEAFSTRLRSAVDPTSITGDLSAVLQNTIQPSSAYVWIRGDSD